MPSTALSMWKTLKQALSTDEELKPKAKSEKTIPQSSVPTTPKFKGSPPPSLRSEKKRNIFPSLRDFSENSSEETSDDSSKDTSTSEEEDRKGKRTMRCQTPDSIPRYSA